MKSIMLSAIAISAAALASCGGGDGGGDSSTITFYAPSTNGLSAAGFNLSETVMNAGIYQPDLPCGGPQAVSSNPFLEGVVVPGGTNTAQIAYAVEFPGSHCVTLNLNGIFTVPAASLSAGNVTGTMGTVQSITESFDGRTVFRIEGLDLDATSVTDVLAGGDYNTFWRLIADGDRPLDGVFSGSGTFSVYCGANNTGASINLTSAATPMAKFLDGC